MALLPFIVFSATMAHAGTRTVNSSGAPLSWYVDQVDFQINPSGKHGLNPDDVLGAVVRGAEQWSLDGSWVELSYQGESDIQAAQYDDGEQVVFFEDDWSGQDPGLLALTYVWSYPEGEIMHFDIAINAEDHTWSVDGASQHNDLWNAMAHEFGHALGFDHSDDEEATMYAQTSLGETLKRDLAADDMEMFASLYGGTAPYNGTAMAGCSSVGGSSAGWGLLAGLLALAGRRRGTSKTERGA